MTSLLRTVDQERVAFDVAAWLKRMRQTLRLSQAKAGQAAGVTRNTFSSWERGRTTPTISQLERLQLFEKNLRRAKGLR